MNLKRLVDQVQGQIDEEALLTLDGSESLQDFEEELDRDVDIGLLDDSLGPFRGRNLKPADDAEMAVAVRGALQLSPAEAADRNVWWWLAVRRYPALVQRRWTQAAPKFLSRERMFGQPNRNALARLWWGAEMARSLPDPEAYGRLMFKNQDLFEALIGRRLARYPHALQVALDELADVSGKDAREIVRDFGFLLSTLVLEAVDPRSIRREIQQLKASRA